MTRKDKEFLLQALRNIHSKSMNESVQELAFHCYVLIARDDIIDARNTLADLVSISRVAMGDQSVDMLRDGRNVCDRFLAVESSLE